MVFRSVLGETVEVGQRPPKEIKLVQTDGNSNIYKKTNFLLLKIPYQTGTFCGMVYTVPLLFSLLDSSEFSLLLVFNNFVCGMVYFSCSTTIRFHTIRLLSNSSSTIIRLHYFSSPDNSTPYDSSPTIIRLHYYSSPLLFVSTTIRLH